MTLRGSNDIYPFRLESERKRLPMLDFAKLLHDAFGSSWPRMFVLVAALLGAFLFGGTAYLIVVAARKTAARNPSEAGDLFGKKSTNQAPPTQPISVPQSAPPASDSSSPSPAAIITNSDIHDNKGPGIINETGQPLVINGTDISGNEKAGIVARPPGQQSESKKKPPEKP